MNDDTSDRSNKESERHEVLQWLQDFLSQNEHLFFIEDGTGEPSELEEMEFLDSLVQGDNHPETFNLIMNTYKKIRDEKNAQ